MSTLRPPIVSSITIKKPYWSANLLNFFKSGIFSRGFEGVSTKTARMRCLLVSKNFCNSTTSLEFPNPKNLHFPNLVIMTCVSLKGKPKMPTVSHNNGFFFWSEVVLFNESPEFFFSSQKVSKLRAVDIADMPLDTRYTSSFGLRLSPSQFGVFFSKPKGLKRFSTILPFIRFFAFSSPFFAAKTPASSSRNTCSEP
ncbi:hypothetical protein AWRI1631_120040 [Saccharomyces cerevisiae AWRI1631]|uniref:Uncharacterized protein n=1 Tax=Saccharomyces cerevisiae (strain AWRI1631) TaxID=545124 RepID=B5VMP6_YEAS6|nr:hypothetical protein AWRI1631_120040 [Saccharomyces cerevisiae AWRI1631]